MLCGAGLRFAPGWSCHSSNIGHIHRHADYEVIFSFDGKPRAVYFAQDDLYVEWNCQGEPILEMLWLACKLPTTVFGMIGYLPILPHMISYDDGHANDCRQCYNYVLPPGRCYEKPLGFSYTYGAGGPITQTDGDPDQIREVINTLPLPIARAITKQFLMPTLESWRGEFNKKYPREKIIERLFRE